jgi:hypothetical protein
MTTLSVVFVTEDNRVEMQPRIRVSGKNTCFIFNVTTR